eukprot:1603689-Rhodomonas_salina.1
MHTEREREAETHKRHTPERERERERVRERERGPGASREGRWPARAASSARADSACPIALLPAPRGRARGSEERTETRRGGGTELSLIHI